MKTTQKNSRKANSTVIFLVILLATAIVLLIVLPLFLKFLYLNSDVEACRASVLVASTTKFAGMQVFDIDCARMNRTFVKADAFRRDAYDEERLKKAVAEEFRKCWYRMGEGAQPFGSKEFISFGAGRHCVICSEMKFDEKLVQSLEKQNPPVTEIKGFREYFSSTIMGPGKYGNPDLTYEEYINNPKLDTSGLKFGDTEQFVITWKKYSPAETDYADRTIPAGPLTLMYVYVKRGSITEDYYTLVLVPSKDVSTLQCGKLWN